MKKLLVIGASILQLPAIKKAKEKGFYVGVADYDPKAIGIPYADIYFNVSTIDVEGIVSLVKQFCPDGIVTLATDMPMRAIARACEECGLPGISYDTAIKATDKGAMINAFEKHGVEHPWFFLVDSINQIEKIRSCITYPCIMKPTDNSGSRGVVLCENLETIIQEYEYSLKQSRNGIVIIEEYLRGPEFSLEVMVLDGIPYVLQITDKITTGAPHFVEMGHSQPTRQPEYVREKLIDLASRAVKAVGIENGPAHVEMILTSQGPKMVELGARLGGDCITTHLVPLSTGIDMVGAIIDMAVGKKPNIQPKFNRGSAICFIKCPKSGLFQGIEGVEKVQVMPGVKEVNIFKSQGDYVGEIESSRDRIGYVICQADNAEDALAKAEKAAAKLTVLVEASNNV